jgi:predicted RNase H-like HicB family nuclease
MTAVLASLSRQAMASPGNEGKTDDFVTFAGAERVNIKTGASDETRASAVGSVDRPLPLFSIYQYVSEALAVATVERLEDGSFFASVADLNGSWGDGPTPAVATSELRDSLVDWVCEKVIDGDEDIPVVGNINLNPR